MKYKPNLKLPFLASLVFLAIISIISIFIIIISIKPVKLNFLNYFDRESPILKKQNISEIGDVYLSFNKITKNFEILIENLVVQNSYFPNVLIGVDLVFDKKIYEMSLKIFNGDVEIKIPNQKFKHSNDNSLLNKITNDFSFLRKFSEIQVVDSKLKVFMDEFNFKNYKIDLNQNKKETNFSISEESVDDNFLSLSYDNFDKKKNIKLDIKKFNFEFLKYFLNFEGISSDKLSITGSSKLIFNENESIDQLRFRLFLDGNIYYPTFKGTEKINFDESLIYGEKNLDNLDIILKFSHKMSDFKTGLRLNLIEKNKSKTFFEINKIEVKKLLEIWPKNLKDSVFFWMKANSSGKIFNFSMNNDVFDVYDNINFSNLKGRFDFVNTEIRYLQSMPDIIKIKGEAKIENSQIVFDITSGESNNLLIRNGFVKLYDLNSDFEKANVNLNIVCKNKDLIKYLDTSPINKKSYAKVRDIIGDVSINLDLDFPLILDLPLENLKYKALVKTNNSLLGNLIQDINLNQFSLEINIDNSEVLYKGKGNIFGSETTFEGKQNFVNEEFVDEINGKLNISSNLAKFLFPNFEFDYNGEILLSYVISENNKGFSKIEGIGDLSNLELSSNFLGSSLDFKNGKVRFLIRPYDNLFSGFLDIKSRNLEVEVNSLFSSDEVIDLDIQKFISPIQDFKFKFKAKSNEYNLFGKTLALDKIKIFENDNFEIENFNLQLDVENFYISGMNFLNSKIDIKKENGIFEYMKINLKGDEDFHKISLEEGEIKKFILESNYVPGLLDIFDLDLNINKGSLKIEGEKVKGKEEYVGVIAGKNLVFYDAPFLANFFSIFSLDGFAQKLKDGGIIFNNLNAEYKLANQRLKIIDSLLKGSELGIQFDSVIGMKDDYFLMNGSIIPAYTINTLITKFPIVGDIVTAGSPEDGLIGANFRVEKIDGDYEIFYNPISVFVPNIIKNFLVDQLD